MDQEENTGSKEIKEYKLTTLTDVQLDLIIKKLENLIDKDQPNKKRDGWDKFSTISSFLSSVLVAGVGLFFTIIYNHREKESQVAIQKAQLQASELQFQSQQRVAELQALISLTPLLASKDTGVSKNAQVVLQALHESSQKSDIQKSNESLLLIYASIAYKPTLSDSQRIRATRNIVAIANNPTTNEVDREKAITYVTKLSQSNEVPATVKEVADSALINMTNKNAKLISTLKPEVAELANRLIDSAKKLNINVLVVSAYRSPAIQDSLYAKGLTKVKASQSAHCKGRAFDLVPYSDGEVQWNNDNTYKVLGDIATSLGLTWGGNFKYFKDKPHFELPIK